MPKTAIQHRDPETVGCIVWRWKPLIPAWFWISAVDRSEAQRRCSLTLLTQPSLWSLHGENAIMLFFC